MNETKHQTSAEAERFHKEAFAEATATGKWMTAVWCVRDGKIELIRRTTSSFPVGDYLAAVGQLAASCFEETGMVHGALPSEPLPLAPGFPRVARQDAVLEEVDDDLPGNVPSDSLGRIEKVEPLDDDIVLCNKPEIVKNGTFTNRPEAPPNIETREGSIPKRTKK